MTKLIILLPTRTKHIFNSQNIINVWMSKNINRMFHVTLTFSEYPGDSNYFLPTSVFAVSITMISFCLFLDLKLCTDEYITRFLLARKYRTEQAATLIAAYQAQIIHRQDIFGNLTARDPALQRALRTGIPGVLPARDRYRY